jgi:hypothetical protein
LLPRPGLTLTDRRAFGWRTENGEVGRQRYQLADRTRRQRVGGALLELVDRETAGSEVGSQLLDHRHPLVVADSQLVALRQSHRRNLYSPNSLSSSW